MSAKAIYEAKGKELLNKYLTNEAVKNRFAVVTETVNWDTLTATNPWLLTEVRGGGGGGGAWGQYICRLPGSYAWADYVYIDTCMYDQGRYRYSGSYKLANCVYLYMYIGKFGYSGS
jgi:hypothetical protein